MADNQFANYSRNEFADLIAEIGVENVSGLPYRPDSSVFDGAFQIATEQTNTSIVFPNLLNTLWKNGCILKLLRYPGAHPHPDLEIPNALAEVGYYSIPEVFGAVTRNVLGQGATDFAILSEFISNATDGFTLACEYASNNQSFAEPAAKLGECIAELHNALAMAFPVSQPGNSADLITTLYQRAETAIADLPQIAIYQHTINSIYHSLEKQLAMPALQRIHGDLHLGQLLYQTPNPAGQNLANQNSAGKWYVLDFEGEPLRPDAQRNLPDFAERDVAGMVRSFAYAAAVGKTTDSNWATQASESFLKRYQQHRTINRTVLEALILDKALYRALYESRHRPNWLHIPIAAIAQIIAKYQVESDDNGSTPLAAQNRAAE